MKVCPECSFPYSDEVIFCPKDGARLVVERETRGGVDPLIGVLLDDRYRILSRIEEGGMGVVYAAEHEVLKKQVALKVLKGIYLSQEHEKRFKREAMAACAVGNPHIVEIHDFGRLQDGRLFFAMELLRGESLYDLIARESPLDLDQTRKIALQVCQGLHAVHEAQIVHRDLKPDNIFLNKLQGQMQVKILDFGIAKSSSFDAEGSLTESGTIFGTPHYMSPEQAMGKAVDRRSDIYSMGVILYQMVTKKVPFIAKNQMEILLQQINNIPVPPLEAAPESPAALALNDIILKAMEKEPERRFATLEEMAASIREAGEGLEELQRPWAPLPEPSLPAEAIEFSDDMPHHKGPDAGASFLLSLERPAVPGRRRLAWVVALLTALGVAGAMVFLPRGEPPETVVAPLEARAQQDARVVDDAPLPPTDRAPPPPQRYRVDLLSQPPGALVYHGGQRLAKTPHTVELPPGDVELEFRVKGWSPVKKTFLIEADREVFVELKRPPRRAIRPRRPGRKAKASPPPEPPRKGMGRWDEE